MQHERFHIKTLEELTQQAAALQLDIPVQEDLSPLFETRRVGTRIAPNSMAVLPMEGADCDAEGSPGEMTTRRYSRYAAGGAGLIWWEACAVVPEGRANPSHMMLTKENQGKIAALAAAAKAAAAQVQTANSPLQILQLTHSGRYSSPERKGERRPMVAHRDPVLDKTSGVCSDQCVVSDAYLDDLMEKMVEAALLARDAGLDGVDVKSCNRYLLSELLAAYDRPGRYGGSFENRSRFLLETVRAIRSAAGRDFVIACRLNLSDLYARPYGFGSNEAAQPDLQEPLELIRLLTEAGVDLLAVSLGNPYFGGAHYSRPFDMPVSGGSVPDEHPMESCARLLEAARRAQAAAGQVPVVGSGYSWFRHFLPNVGAAALARGDCGFVGLGRSSLAYPDAPLELMRNGAMAAGKCCVTCSQCTQLLRSGEKTGCVVRDRACYSVIREAT